MTLNINFAVAAWSLLALSFVRTMTTPEKTSISLTIKKATPNLNLTQPTSVTLSTTHGSTASAADASNKTQAITSNTSSTQNTPFTNATTETPGNTNQTQVNQSTTFWTSVTGSILTTTITQSTESPTLSLQTSQATQTTVFNVSTPYTIISTVYPTINTTSETINKGSEMNTSEKNMTILFSVILGMFAVGFSVYMLHRCKQRMQYMHQPLYNTEDTDQFVADNDALVISGGLYDAHPLNDNQPTAPTEPSQLRLEFLNEAQRNPTF